MEADFVKTDLPKYLKVPQVAGSKGIYLTFSLSPSCRSGLCLQKGCMSVEVIKSLLNILALELECPGSGPCHLKGPLSFVELLKMILQTWATKKLLLASVWPCFVFSKHCANFFFLLFEVVYQIQVLIICQSLLTHQNFTKFTEVRDLGQCVYNRNF